MYLENIEQVKCPCCGQTTSVAPAVVRALLAPIERRVYDAIVRYPLRYTSTSLANIVYADDPNGGPESGKNVMCVTVNHINKKFKRFGWRIVAMRPGSRGGYKLTKTDVV